MSIETLPLDKFEYPPLQDGQIRLLTPSPGDPKGLTWELDVVALPDEGKAVVPPDYDALSYTWGELHERFPIMCNGKTLEVHRNLYIALPYLARRLQQAGSSPRLIWIDAVCINQKDDKVEKPKHIGRMADIYRSARQVLVWLGPGHGAYYNNAAIALVPLITQIGKEAFRHTMDPRQPEPDFKNQALPAESSPIWQVISDIAFNDWYTRLWVVQELALARSIVALIGESTLDFEALKPLIGFMTSIVWGDVGNSRLGWGVKALQKECIQRNFDIVRLLNSFKFIVLHGILNDTPDMDPQKASPLPEMPAITTGPSKRWRQFGAGLLDRFRNWRAGSAPRWFTGPSDELSVASSISTTVPSSRPQSPDTDDSDLLLAALFITTLSQQCTEARDRVFGVLAFCDDKAEIKALGLEDMWDPAELAKLYSVFMGYAFERGGHLTQDPGRRLLWELFSFACLPKKTAGLPSWCPDLHMQRGPSTPNGLSLQAERGFSTANEDNNILGYASNDFIYAADGGVMNMRRGSSQNTFVVRGTVFGLLKEVYPAFPGLNLSPDRDEMKVLKNSANIGQWEQTIASRILGPQGDRAKDGGSVSLDTYWRTLVGNRTSLVEGDSEFTYETLYSLRDLYVRISRLKTKLEELIERYGSYGAACSEGGYTSTEEYKETIALRSGSPPAAFARNMIGVQLGRQLFTTADGRFGFGDVGMQEGDVVCVFNGAVTPHVLRKVDGDDESYYLVAAACVHGMMNGEIQELGLEAEDIHLI